MNIEIVFIRIILDDPKGQEATQTWNNDHIFRVPEAYLRPQRSIRRGGAPGCSRRFSRWGGGWCWSQGAGGKHGFYTSCSNLQRKPLWLLSQRRRQNTLRNIRLQEKAGRREPRSATDETAEAGSKVESPLSQQRTQ